jgi:very-short-patch-repair endonuclease
MRDERLKHFARAMRRDGTDAEKRTWRLLRGRRFAGFKFRRQVPIGPYIVDFMSFEAMLVIEIDGGQHAESAADARRDAWLVREGFRVLRFWNNEVLTQEDSVVVRIAQRLGLAWSI